MKNIFIGFLLVTLSTEIFAIGGADLLLNNVSTPTQANQASDIKSVSEKIVFEGFKLNDPFAIQLFSEWRTVGKIDYEVNSWFLTLLQGHYEKAAHLLTVMENKMPNTLNHHLMGSRVYLYHKLGLNQSFFDSWVDTLEDKDFINSRIGITLGQYVDQFSKDLFSRKSVVISSEQRNKILSLKNNNSLFYLYSKATLDLRTGENAYQSLISLPAGHPFRIPLAQTTILGMAKSNDLAGAGKLLKKYLEPEIEKVNDPYVLGEYYLNLARFLYQAGALEAAITFYLKVPDRHPSFIEARAELMWSYLRTNNVSKLRGQIASLKTSLFDKYFIPEIYVVRSISNLKLCQYDEVQNDFKAFVTSNKVWIKKINENLTKEQPDIVNNKAFFTILASDRVKSITNEIRELKKLAKRSIKAALPAVGVQPHWKKSITYLSSTLVEAQKNSNSEFRRPWINRKKILTEAIKKMKFIKIEAMTQLRSLARNHSELSKGSISSNPVSKENSKGKMIFPFDGTFWADEVLNLEAKAKSFCLKRVSL